MKKFLLLLAIAAVAGAMYVTAAPAGQTAAGPTAAQFAALKKQVATLQKQVTKVKKSVTLVGDVVFACMLHQTVGVAQRGDPAGTYGYSFTNGATTLTTALDLSSSPTYTLLTLNPDSKLGCSSLVGLGGLKHFHGLARR